MLVSARNGHEAESAQQPVTRPTAAQDRSVSRNEPHTNHNAITRPASPEFRRAVKRDAKIRFAICGPSGSGKTYTLLRLATELGGSVALIDTEHGSASKYADLFEFDVLELESYDPARLIQIIDHVACKGYRVLCIDSLSHFWMGKDGELDKVDRAAQRMQNPNGFAAWKQVTPLHNALIDKLISAPLHILASMRAKTEWILDRDDRTGKTVQRKVGLAPVMRDGIEYEFDVCGDMDQENTLIITKTRCPRLTGGVFPKPGKELADVLKEWLGGAAVDKAVEPEPPSETLVAPAEPKKKGATSDVANGTGGGMQTAAVLNDDLAAIWKRMCSPRGWPTSSMRSRRRLKPLQARQVSPSTTPSCASTEPRIRGSSAACSLRACARKMSLYSSSNCGRTCGRTRPSQRRAGKLKRRSLRPLWRRGEL